MGLDNGITLRSKSQISFPMGVVPSHTFITREDDPWYEYDLCYWRKCWNIRGEIADEFGDEFVDCGDTDLTPKGILAIRDRLYNMLIHPSRWNADDDIEGSIWEYDEIQDTLVRDIINLTWAAEALEKGEITGYVYFYDSY